MLTDMTRSRLIQLWFTAVALVIVAGIALGEHVDLYGSDPAGACALSRPRSS